MRTFLFLFSTLVFSLTPKHATSQNEKIRIDEDKEATVDEVFQIIKTQTDYMFIYHRSLFKDFPKVQLKKGTISLNKLLSQSLSEGDFNMIVTKDNTILIKERSAGDKRLQQQVSGRVTDQTGLPVPGATVLIKGTTNGTATNIDGHYKLMVPDPQNVLVISSLGFETQEITVGNQTTINVSLKESISALDEVVIKAGYYNTTEREQVGSIDRIDTKTIDKQPVSNPLAAMQGYLPGVNITQTSGTAGGGFNIEIRGKNFLNPGSSNPLYIVDGVPYSSESLSDPTFSVLVIPPNFGTDRSNISPLNLIDPASIESIEVLKDADATAIYGARGANGVVLITTKKGKAGKTSVKVNVTTGMGGIPRFEDLLNTQQYLEMRREAFANDGIVPTASNAPDLILWDQERYTDWQEVLLGGTVYSKTAQVSFSGGSEQTRFFLSGRYENETTVFPGDFNYGKTSMHSNVNHRSTDGRLQLNLTIDYAADDNLQPTLPTIQEAYQLPPNAPATHDENGNLSWEGWTFYLRHPFRYEDTEYRAKTNNLIINTVLSYSPVPELEIKANLGYTVSHNEAYRTYPHTAYGNPDDSGYTSLRNSVLLVNPTSSESWIVEPQLHWQKDWGKLRVKALIGTTFQQQQSRQISMDAVGFTTNDQILNLAAAEFSGIDNDVQSEYRYQSVFGRLNVNWADQYIVNLTGRRDGSSKFGPGRQFGNFGAVGAAWIFSEASFFKENDLLSFGKLRSSYGLTGSDTNLENYAFYDAYQVSPTDIDYGGSTLEPVGIFNPVFQWETNKKFEVALELGLFQDRIFLTAAWYNNRSSNQLVGIPLPGSTGFSTITGNFDATVENKGLEIDFRSINLQNNNFKWTTTFNISVPKNKLVKFDGLETSTFKNQYVVGQPLSIEKLYQTTGVNPVTGLYEVVDFNGDNLINANDRQWVEQTAPKFYGGLGNTLEYKNWTLDIFFQFKNHRAVHSAVRGQVGFPGSLVNQPVSVLNRWQQVGDQVPIQRYGTVVAAFETHSYYSQSNASYSDASFIKLRNASLNYRLPKDTVSGMDVGIYVQGHNLLTLTKFKGRDPDLVTPYRSYLPLLRKFTLGLQLGF